MLANIKSDEDAKNQAHSKILELLSNTSYINPDKFTFLLNDYRKKQKAIDAELNISLKQNVIFAIFQV